MNKNKALLIVLGLLFSMHLNAQNEFKVGINVGANYPDVRGNEYAQYNNFELGYLFGVSFDYYLKENLSIKANINYERKFKKLKLIYYTNQGQEIETEHFRQIYEYINIPILLKCEFGNSRFFVNGGPFFNYLLNDKIKPQYPNEQRATGQKKIDLGLSLGVGTSMSLNEKNDLTIEIRDDFGMIDTGGVPPYISGTAKTNTIRLILGWNIGI